MKEKRKNPGKADRRWQLALEAVEDGVFDWNLQKNDLFLSPQYKEMLGYDDNETGTGAGEWENRIHPEDRDRFHDNLGACLEGKTRSFYGEYRMLSVDGTYRRVLYRAKVVERSGDGKPLRLIGTVTDITDRKQAEEKLQNTEKSLRELFENSRDGFVFIDAEGRFLNANKAYCQMLGYTLEELRQKKDFLEITPPKWHESEWKEVFEKLLYQEDYSKLYEKEYIRKDGTVFPVELQTHALHDKGKLLYIWGIVRDITERKQSEKQLKENQERVSNILNAIEDVVWSLSMQDDGVELVYMSPSVEKIFGRKVEEFIEKGPLWLECVHPDDMKIIEENYERLEEDNYSEAEFRVLNIDGSIRWVNSRIKIVQNEKGEPVRMDGIITDITERKQTEEQLRQSEEKVSSVLNSIEDVIWSESLQDKGYMYLSPSIEKMSGRKVEEFHKNRHLWAEMIHPDDISNIKDVYDQLDREGSSLLECRIVRPDGSIRWVSNRVKIIQDEKGEPVRMDALITDITERKKLEEDRLAMERSLLHAQKLESLGVLAGGIAHDFNNLLMTIIGNLDMSLLNLPSVSVARSRIENAVKASHRAADLTNQMLAYSGRGHFVIRDIDINELIREYSHIFRSSISKSVGFQLNLDPDIPAILADTGQIQQIIMNLITNASEAIGDKNGNITLATGVMDCEAGYFKDSCIDEKPPDGKYVFLEASDTGCGMDKETKEKMFDPFFTTKFTGRGLGLAAALGIIKGHKGAIFVESEKGMGTTLKVLFPASGKKTALKTVKPGAERLENISDGKINNLPKTVLIVDDEKSVLDMCNDMVIEFGYKTLVAGDGKMAVKIYKQHAREIDCVILDLSMPRMDGYATFKELKKINPGVKVLLSSGYDKSEATLRFEGQGLEGFIKKPYTMDALRKKLEKIAG